MALTKANGQVISITATDVVEVLNIKTGATGNVTHDYATGAIWYHSSIAGNFTANFILVPETTNITLVLTLILQQGSVPYMPTAVSINGNAIPEIKWLGGGTTPAGHANKIDIVSLTLVRSSDSQQVLGSVSTYG